MPSTLATLRGGAVSAARMAGGKNAITLARAVNPSRRETEPGTTGRLVVVMPATWPRGQPAQASTRPDEFGAVWPSVANNDGGATFLSPHWAFERAEAEAGMPSIRRSPATPTCPGWLFERSPEKLRLKLARKTSADRAST